MALACFTKRLEMKFRLQALLIAVIAFSFYSCSSTSSIYLKEDIQKHSLNNSFAVIPMSNDWIPDAVISPMTRSTRNYLNMALASAFQTATSNSVEVIDNDIELPEGSFVRTQLVNEEMTLDVSLPPDSLLNSFPERYVYFFEGYGFRIAEKTVTGSSYAGNEPETYSVLIFQTEFYLFDKSNKEIISWGVVGDETEIVNTPEYNHYLDVMNKISRKIISNSPFPVVRP